jgi:hypothetical protein
VLQQELEQEQRHQQEQLQELEPERLQELEWQLELRLEQRPLPSLHKLREPTPTRGR